MSIPVKLVYLNSRRRPGSFTKLAEVLKFIEGCSEFPERFVLKYKDDENELMTVTSEKEFGEALQLCQKQKVLQIECTEAAATELAALKKGEALPHEDDEPFQIIRPDVEQKDGKAEVQPGEKPVNALIQALDQKASPPATLNNSLTQQPPLVLLDALLANISGKTPEQLQTTFRSTRAAFIQELAACKSQLLDQQAADQKRADDKAAADLKLKEQQDKETKQKTAAVPVAVDSKEKSGEKPVEKTEKPVENKAAVPKTDKEEKKRGSQSSEKPVLTRPNSKHQKQLDELEGMGFKDPVRNEALLNKYNGNVSKAINVLIHT